MEYQISNDDPNIAWGIGAQAEVDGNKLIRVEVSAFGGCQHCDQKFVAIIKKRQGVHLVRCPHCREPVAIHVTKRIETHWSARLEG